MRDDQNNEGRVSKTDGDDSKRKRTRIKAILDPKGSLLRSWNMMFLVSCVIAVLMDPLFLYLPIISREKKCLYLDKRLKIIAYSLRSFTDLIYILNMILQLICPYIDEASRKLGQIKVVTNVRDIAKRYILLRYFVIDVFAILPLTQVSFSIIFIEMRDSGLPDNMRIPNIVVFCQYVPRVLRIYISGMNLTTSPMARLVWVKALFNFFLYLLVAHVLGAVWYLFSIQRLMVCWHSACQNTRCTSTSFKCNHSSSRRALSDDYCSANTTFFDFGIYHEALQSSTVESTNFFPRLTHCFWWGLRNLSSFGQNLQPSTLFLETFFVFCISISGLVLLVYFVGNEQASRQVVIQRSERVIRNMKIKEQETDLWISRNQLPRSMKKEIMTTIQLMLEEDEHIDVQNLLFALPNGLGRRIKHCICLPMLKKVPQLQGKSEQLLQLICDCLKPVHYNQQSYIVREGEPLDAMLFITHGILWNFTTNNIANRSTRCIEKGSFFGEELLDWGLECSPLPNLSDLPISPKTAKTHTKVEAFVLMANDLRIIVSRRTQAASTIQAAFRRFARKKENSLSSLRRRSTLIEMTSALLPRGNRS